jgi:hypothetical protein
MNSNGGDDKLGEDADSTRMKRNYEKDDKGLQISRLKMKIQCEQE